VPTRTHMRYQIFTVAPYWFKTFVLRRKGLQSPTLYKFDEYSEGNGATPIDETNGKSTGVEVEKHNDSPA
jgi:hypothetical protein